MSTIPPIPLLSLLRRIISEISLKRVPISTRPPRTSGVFTSLLRAAAIPSLGYLFGWNSHLKATYVSFHATTERNDDSTNTLGGKEGQSGKPSRGELTQDKTLGEQGSMDEKRDPAKAPKRPQYDPNSPIYQLMNNPALYDPIRRPRNPIVLAHGMLHHSPRLAGGVKVLRLLGRPLWI
jgi:hypothetical protein